ncbi:ABC transporter substrate-binding protein [Vibrio algarum]|uniref:ABC transporter substrate-binding protein n=1 Tax=Vibrio algarum TaxID=3020714 RepID=A0ABT4YVD7_9VIBR|nr:ABC transporter substrate-binding protein [Vibrio sp. KJ40-1]MDB1125340.1 ABC transporter substrate-binding protein [Vibrio sp. KJ40-1]
MLLKNVTNSFLISAFACCASFNALAEIKDGIDTDKVKGSITFYTNRTDLLEAGTYDRYEKEFKKLYPNVDSVNVVAFADYRSSIRPRMNTNEYGDLLFILPSVPSGSFANFFEPLNSLYKEEEVYFYNSWAEEGTVYGISSGNSLEGLVYNKQVLKDAGVEVPLKTLTEFFDANKKIKESGKTPIYINFGAKWPLQVWDKFPLVVEGNENVYEKMLKQDTPFSGDTAYNASFNVLKKLIDNGYTEDDLMTNSWENSKDFIAKGEAGMYYLGNWVVPQLIERGADPENIGFMPIPSDESGNLNAQMNHDWGYAISKQSKNKETAKAYMKFLLEVSDFDSIAGFIPTVKSKEPTLPQLNEYMSYQPNVIQSPKNSSQFIEVANNSRIDFYSGGYVQDLITASDFTKALKQLDQRWNRARKRLK